MANFWLIELGIKAYVFIEDMNYHFAKLYTNISTNMDSTDISHFSRFFAHKFFYFTQNIANIGTYSAWNHG